MMTRFSTAAVLTWLVVVVTAAPAIGAVRLDLDPTAVPPGTTVTASTVDEAMVMIPSGRLELFLGSPWAVHGAKGPHDSRLTPIGTLTADKNCVGRLSFTAPDLPAGNYVVAAYCAECTPGMTVGDTCNPNPRLAEKSRATGTMFTVGEFEVLAAAPLPRTGTPPLPAAGAGVLLLALGAVILLRDSSPRGNSRGESRRAAGH